MERVRSSFFGAGFLVSALLAVFPFNTAVAARAVPCGTVYTVVSGDTLDAIAARAYGGKGFLSGKIFEANSDFLRDVRRLEIGDQLLIPCLDGTGVQSRAAALDHQLVERTAARIDAPVGAIASDTATAAAPAPDAGPVAVAGADELRLLADGGFAPFAAQAEDAGGLVTDLLRRAIAAEDAEQAVSVSFVADRAAHLTALLPSTAFDVSFPWVQPDCSQPATLGTDALRRCETLTYSRPLIEVTVAFYGRIGDPLVTAANLEALAGKRICRPEVAMIPDLALGPDSALSQTAPTAEDCFERLRNSEVDAVSLLKDRADAAIGRLGFGEGVIEIPALRSTRTLHAVAMKGSLAGEAALAEIDRGIERIMLSGGWFETLAAHRSQDAALR